MTGWSESLYISLFAIKAATESRHTEQGTTAQTCKHKKEKKMACCSSVVQ